MAHLLTISSDPVTEKRIKDIVTAVGTQGKKVHGSDVRRVAIKLLYDMIIDMELKGMKYKDMFESYYSKKERIIHESLR